MYLHVSVRVTVCVPEFFGNGHAGGYVHVNVENIAFSKITGI